MIPFFDHGEIDCSILSHLGSDINRVLKFPLIPVLIVSSSLVVAAFIYIALVVWGRFQRKRNDDSDSSSSVIFNIFYQILSYYKFKLYRKYNYANVCLCLTFPINLLHAQILNTFNNLRFNCTFSDFGSSSSLSTFLFWT